jgi:hypothetical protein
MAATDTPLFGFRLVSPDGDTLGTVESAIPRWQTGDTVTTDGVRYRVRSAIPLEVIAEFVDDPLNGVLEVEPL